MVEIDRWEYPDEQESGARVEDHLASQLEGFRQERADWEFQRQRELERLRREGTVLAEAWRRLEAEQRSLLAERELLRQGVARGSQSAFSSSAGPFISQPVESATQDVAACSANGQDHTASLQFQQLRRAMQSHDRTGT